MFSKKLEYSYKIIIFLKQSNIKVAGLEIMEKLNIPKYYGLGILTRLVHSGLVSSEKGKGGGFYLAKLDISLLELYMAVEEEKIENFTIRGFKNENIDQEINYNNIVEYLEKKLKLEMHKIII